MENLARSFILLGLWSKLNASIKLFVLIGPFLVLVLVLVFWSENVIFHDDYALLGFLVDWTDPALSWGNKLHRLVEPHNHHRLVYDRLVTLATYYLTGKINVTIMIVLGNMALLGIVWRLWTLFRDMKLPVWYFTPVPFWMLNLQSHENMLWGMAALQNFTVVWLMMEALHRLLRRDALTSALLLSIAALFTSGNGLMVAAVGTLIVGWQWTWRTDGWLWIGGMGLALILFFWGYDPAPPVGSLLDVVPRLLMVLGASLTNQARFGSAMVGGILVLLTWMSAFVLINQTRNRQIKANWQTDTFSELLAITAIVLGTAIILGISRPLDELLRDRYRIYSHLAFSLTYLLGLLLITPPFRSIWAVLAGSAAVTMYGISAYAKIPELINLRQNRQLDAFNVRFYGTTLPPPYYAESNRKVLKQAQERGVLKYPDIWSDPAHWKLLPFRCRIIVEPFKDLHPTVFVAKNNHFLRVHSAPAFFPRRTPLSSDVCLIAESASGRRYALPAMVMLNKKLDFLTTGRRAFS
ncbi:hypothetical protein [Spirosoma utsteinense]|uniref:hypothetical protein n=1 Tax=Spirosoma utsteinense TaxID=2585773 RepID=UPI0016452B52|nr:hypothetical protein [Spirosoma utsteinense]MBC3783897.1 putative integral membrane protein [Spirosoma utsteinense]